jgi:hypothetical protein
MLENNQKLIVVLFTILLIFFSSTIIYINESNYKLKVKNSNIYGQLELNRIEHDLTRTKKIIKCQDFNHLLVNVYMHETQNEVLCETTNIQKLKDIVILSKHFNQYCELHYISERIEQNINRINRLTNICDLFESNKIVEN